MHIQQIRIHAYKSVAQLQTIVPDKTVSIFVGKNNAGKSTLLDSLFRFFRPLQSPQRFADQKAFIEVDVYLNEKDRAQLAKQGNSQLTEQVTLILKNEVFYVRTKDQQSSFTDAWAQFFLQKTVRIGSLRDLDFVKMKKIYEEFQSGWPKVFKKFINTLQQFFPEIKSVAKLFHGQQSTINTKIKEFGELREIERLGVGYQQLFIQLLYFFHPRYEIVLIDEPEIHLHPSMVKRLFELYAQSENEKQIFLTSHSPLFIQAKYLENVYRVVHEGPKGTVFYSIPQARVNVDNQRLIQELNADNLEMFMADHVLLVEGISDRIFMRTLLDRFFPTSKDVKVIPLHGKENVDVYAQLLGAFHIPFSVMLDSDSLKNTSMQLINSVAPNGNDADRREKLMKKRIFILPGNLESCYPPHDSRWNELPKPLRSLKVSQKIQKKDLDLPVLSPIKQILFSIV